MAVEKLNRYVQRKALEQREDDKGKKLLKNIIKNSRHLDFIVANNNRQIGQCYSSFDKKRQRLRLLLSIPSHRKSMIHIIVVRNYDRIAAG